MAHLVPIPFIVILVALLILAELRGDRRTVYWTKPLATLLVIAVAELSWQTPAAESRYTAWVLVGLALSLVGDVALMFPQPKAFLIGLVGFLLAHVAYTIVFTLYNPWQPADWVTAFLLLLAAGALYRYLEPNLGKMKRPVILYIVVICVMVNRAVSTLFGDALTPAQGWLIALGAFLFWLSDLMLGINKFGRPFRWNRLSLALYYGGQLLIASSASYF